LGNHLYHVAAGRAYPMAPGHDFPLFQRGDVWEPEIEAVFALAEDHAGALSLARAYDRGELWPHDVALPGGLTVFALQTPAGEPEPLVSTAQGAAIIAASAVAGLIIAAALAAVLICTGSPP
jgi:hypothetical protein